MIDNLIRLGKIVSINNDFPVLRAQVQAAGSEEVETVVLWNNWGENSWPTIGSPCLIFVLNCNFAQKYALPFNLLDAISVLAGEKLIYTATGTKIHLKQDGGIDINALNDATSPSINISATAAVNIKINTNITGDCDVSGVYKVAGTQVVSNQQGIIPNPTGGVTIDAEARTAINSILTAMRTHGLIAS